VKPIGATALFLGLALGLLLVVRRAMGAVTQPLPPWLLLATSVALLAWALFVQLTWRMNSRGQSRSIAGELRSPEGLFTLWLPALTLVLFTIACSAPFSRLIDWFVWPPTIVAVAVLWYWLIPARRSSPAATRVEAAEQVLQQLTRFRTATGREAVRGTMVAEFTAGQREATLHVAFCPPFERLPEIDAHVNDGSMAAVKVAQRLHNGAQLDIRLLEPAEEPFTVAVEFFAAEPAPTDNPGPSLAV
jgi:hypothetical protein